MRRLTVCALLFGLAATPARAVMLDDLLAHGYTIAAATRLPGAWAGCIRQHRLTFADGTVFACATTAVQTGYDPRAYVLRLAGGPPSVVLVAAAVLPGELLRLRLHDFAVPLRMNPTPLPPEPVVAPGALQPTGAIPSVDTLTAQQNAPLQQQQALLPAPRIHSHR